MTDTEATPENQTPSQSGLVDLSDLRLMPAWVAGIGAGQTAKKFHDEEDRPQRPGHGDRRGGPPGRRDERGGFGGRDRGGFGGRDRGTGTGGPGRDRDRRGGGPRRFDDRDREQRPQREWLEVPRDIHVTIEPEDKAVDALASHIRSSGHAFSMFDAARLVLAGGERFHARFACAPERATGLFVTPASGGAFLSRDEALQYLLHNSGLDDFYRVEEVELEEPKGDFKSIGVCGLSGELLGPPNHHSFQSAVIRLHRERFSHMPLEDYKRRVRVEANPDLVAQWKEKQRKGQRWIYLKEEPAEGAEPTTLTSRADMEAHFRRTHGDDAVKEVREIVLPGNIDKAKLTPVLFILLRNAVDTARKHLFEMSQKLGGGFERRGLKLFKRRAGKLYVSRVKPRAIDPGVVFSARVATLVEQLKGHAGLMLHDLVEKIAPSQPQPAAESAAVEESPAAKPADPTAATTEAPAKAQLSDEQISVIKDIRWLANEGYVIEYSDGMVFLGVQGEPAAPKPAAEKTAARKNGGAPAGEDPGAAEPVSEAAAPDQPEASGLSEVQAEPATRESDGQTGSEPELGAQPEAGTGTEATGGSAAQPEPEEPVEPGLEPEVVEAAADPGASQEPSDLEGAELSPPEAEQEEFALVEKRVEP